MKQIFLLICAVLTFDGCYTPNQTAFESFARKQVTEGMATPDAIRHLQSEGFTCNDEAIFLQNTSNSVACVRHKDNLFPLYTCLERIEFLSGFSENRVEKLTIGEVACSGL
jgi:hypothetical protein